MSRRTWSCSQPFWVLQILALCACLAAGSDARAQFGNILRKAKEQSDKARQVQKALAPMTVEEEREVGREIAAKLIAYFHLYRSEPLTRYVNMVGATVAAKAERQEIHYRFAVLDSDGINAFSAPGGYILISRGALELCADESELAGVLAHEVGHVAGRHVLRIVERDKALRAGMEEAQAHTPGSAYLQNISKNILIKMIDQGLAPADEFDADARGIKYAHAAGYPADGLQRFLTKLDRATQQGGKSFWTRTHPPVGERNQRIGKTISAQHWEDAGRPNLADRYAAETKAVKSKPGI